MALKPHLQLNDLGSKLETLPSSKDTLIELLKQAAACLTDMDQSPSASALESMKPFLNAIVKPELLKHQDRDAKLLVATCVCEITRITAPEAPYSDDVLKDIFQLIVSTFSGLSDISSPSFGQEVRMLETLAKYRSCVVMLDLECDDLVNEMFSTFFAVARDDHPESVLSSMQNIMGVLLEESEDVPENLLSSLLSTLGREKRDVTAAARKLSMNVIKQMLILRRFSSKKFSFEETVANLHLKLENMNDFDLGLNALEYEVWLGDVNIGGAELSKSAKLEKSGGISYIDVPVTFRPKDFGSALWDMIRGKGTGYTMKGNIDVDTPFGAMKLPISKEGGTTRLKKNREDGGDDDDDDED